MGGLKHRFPEAIRYNWLYWYECSVCGANGFDALHHIVSPSTRHYRDLKCNESILNSAPVHNYTPTQIKRALKLPGDCHIGNESFLGRDDIVKMLLQKTLTIQTKELGYVLQPIDREFMAVYKALYTS